MTWEAFALHIFADIADMFRDPPPTTGLGPSSETANANKNEDKQLDTLFQGPWEKLHSLHRIPYALFGNPSILPRKPRAKPGPQELVVLNFN